MLTVLIFIIILSLLVLVHEFGHFAVARFFKITVHEFALGFPPRALAFRRDPKTGKFRRVSKNIDPTIEEESGTVYSINFLPLGGFVRIKGEDSVDRTSPGTFGSKPVYQRLLVVVAGVVMNILLAAVIFTIGFWRGLPTDVSNGVPKGAYSATPAEVMIQDVEKDSPAALAGLKMGDKVKLVNGQPVGSSAGLSATIRSAGSGVVALEIDRQGQSVFVSAIAEPVEKDGESVYRLGVLLADVSHVRFGFFGSIVAGFSAAGRGFVATFVAIVMLIKDLVLGQGLAFEVSGPVGIAGLVGTSAKLGFSYLLQLTAMLSLSLAVVNILPIPALDGGRAMFLVIEGIFRRSVPEKFERILHQAGFGLLMILILVITVRDVLKLF